MPRNYADRIISVREHTPREQRILDANARQMMLEKISRQRHYGLDFLTDEIKPPLAQKLVAPTVGAYRPTQHYAKQQAMVSLVLQTSVAATAIGLSALGAKFVVDIIFAAF